MTVEFDVDSIKPMTWNDDAYGHLVYSEQLKNLVLTFVANYQRMKGKIEDVIVGKGNVATSNCERCWHFHEVKDWFYFCPVLQVLARLWWRKLLLTRLGDHCTIFKLKNWAQILQPLDSRSRMSSKWLESEWTGHPGIFSDLKLTLDQDEMLFYFLMRLMCLWLRGFQMTWLEMSLFPVSLEVHRIQTFADKSVFLRELEYFKGIIFLTTNLYSSIDAAFRSRVSIHLIFNPAVILVASPNLAKVPRSSSRPGREAKIIARRHSRVGKMGT